MTKTYLTSLFLMVAGLAITLWLGLLPALLSGLFIYFTIEAGSGLLKRTGVVHSNARIILLVVVILTLISLLTIAVLLLISFMSHGQESLAGLMQRMADIIEAAKSYMPAWIQDYLPDDIKEWQKSISAWLRGNAGYLSGLGKNAGVLLLHIIFGVIIGGLVAVSPPEKDGGILARALKERIVLLGNAFRRIVFSQFKISALNCILTAIFLGIILPLTGNPLPFLKTMIGVTFIVGLLPIIGNLISNSVIFLIALSVSSAAATSALVFLIVIHKVEYLFNAQIVSLQIKSRAWEIMLAMLIMESAFGIAGLIAAPIYYAYIKSELMAQKLI